MSGLPHPSRTIWRANKKCLTRRVYQFELNQLRGKRWHWVYDQWRKMSWSKVMNEKEAFEAACLVNSHEKGVPLRSISVVAALEQPFFIIMHPAAVLSVYCHSSLP